MMLSIRSLLILVACIALALASLRLANSVWNTVIGGMLMAGLGVSMLYSIFERGEKQAFAIGFFSIALLYLCTIIGHGFLVSYIQSAERTTTFDDTGIKSLPTSVALELIYDNVVHRDYDEEEIEFTTEHGPQKFRPYIDLPRKDYFLSVGHRLFSMLFGVLGAIFAAHIYRKRNARTSSNAG